MKMKIIILLLIVISTQGMIAKKQGNIWYFGSYAGLDFNSGHPVEIQDGKLNGGPSSIICDQNGKLLFYTNGSKVWNKQHKIMDNGLKLIGDDIVCSVTIIVRKPGNENIFFIFSKYNWNLTPNICFTYSIVHLDSNNGLGKVIEKNIVLMESSTNHLTATLHKNGEDIWIITREHYANHYYKFNSFFVTSKGVNPNPIVSDGCYYSGYDNYRQGQMKMSPNGKYLLFVGGLQWIKINAPNEESRANCTQELYEFDNETGVISNGIKFGSRNDTPKGVEFSNDAKMFYISYCRQYNNPQYRYDNRIVQYQTDKILQRIESSITLYNETKDFIGFFELQLAPDGKIYMPKGSNTKYLAVINNPNALGSDCNFVNDGFLMEFGQPYSKLPISLQSYYLVNVDIIGNDNYCEGDTIILNPKFSGNFVNPFYDWRGPKNFNSTNEICLIQDADINNSGTYTLKVHDKVTGFTAESYKYIQVNPRPKFRILPNDSIFKCELSTITLSSSTYDNSNEYSWSTGETSSSINVDTAGMYYLTVTNEYGCQSTDSVVVDYKYIQPDIEIIGDIPACEGDTIVLKTKGKYDIYNWSTVDTTSEIYVTKSIKCSVSVVDSLGCTGTSEEVNALFYPTREVNLKGPDTVCLGSTVTYHVNKNNNVGYGWNVELGSLVPGFYSDSVKVIWLQTGKGKIAAHQTNSYGCTSKDSLYVEIIDEIKPEIIPPKPIICGNADILLKTSDQYESYEWSTGETSESISVSEAGEYWVKVTVGSGCLGYDTVYATRAENPSPEIMGNEVICSGTSNEISVDKEYVSYLWNTGDTSQTIIISQAGEYAVEVADSNGCRGYASMDINEFQTDIAGLNDIDLGRISIDDETKATLTLSNESSGQITIGNIELQSWTEEYQIETIPETPAILQTGETITISVNFNPRNPQSYNDKLFIKIIEPCDTVIEIQITGDGAGKILVLLPDTSGEVGSRICIPLKAKIANTRQVTVETNYDSEIKLKAEAFLPENNYIIDNSAIKIRFSGQPLVIDNEERTIGEICGGIMLGRNNVSPLLISEFRTGNPYFDIEIKDGSLRIDGCAIDMSRIVFNEQLTMRVQPNPATEIMNLNLTGDEEGEIIIQIYDMMGRQAQELHSEKNLKNMTLSIDVSGLSNGIYYFIVKVNGNLKSNRAFIIQK